MFLTIKQCTHAKLNSILIELIIYIKMDLAFNNLQRYYAIKPTKSNQIKSTDEKLSRDRVK